MANGVATIVHLLHPTGTVVGHVHAEAAAAGAAKCHQLTILFVELYGEVAAAAISRLLDFHFRQHIGALYRRFHILDLFQQRYVRRMERFVTNFSKSECVIDRRQYFF